MGVYIPNMEKPKDCFECILADKHLNVLCEVEYNCRLEATECPLIEIDLVRCGECKWFINEGSVTICDTHETYIEPTDFCSYGERRADGDI